MSKWTMVWIYSGLSSGWLIHHAAQESIATPTGLPFSFLVIWTFEEGLLPANNSLERTQPQRGFMYDVAVLRRSARGC